MRKRARLRWGVLIAILVMAAGCGDSQDTSTSKNAPPAASTPSGYQATLEEGINFGREGLPTFISQVEGLSGREPFGRWSDANLAPAVRVVFRDALPRKFEIAITAAAFEQNDKLPVVVRAGGVEQSFSVEKGPPQTQLLVFDLPRDTNTIEIVAPKPVAPKTLDPKSVDDRRLGIALVSLKIRKL